MIYFLIGLFAGTVLSSLYRAYKKKKAKKARGYQPFNAPGPVGRSFPGGWNGMKG